jgi:hypothetical protein
MLEAPHPPDIGDDPGEHAAHSPPVGLRPRRPSPSAGDTPRARQSQDLGAMLTLGIMQQTGVRTGTIPAYPAPAPGTTPRAAEGTPYVSLRPDQRVFLFLQGPHGPFFRQLARASLTGRARTCGSASTVAITSSGPTGQAISRRPTRWTHGPDRSRDPGRQGHHRPRGLWRHPPDPRHRHRGGRRRGITVHVFEEGYLRPYWVTYERGGANGTPRSCR